jgi:hypothetical protein
MEAEMHIDVERQLPATHEPLSIVVDQDVWDLYVYGVTRVERDWFVQMAVVGPRVCTLTLRVDAARGRGMAAREIIRLVRAWILEDETNGRVYLEHKALPARAS